MFGIENKKLLHSSIIGMRVTLGIIFLWFGLLKIFSESPVHEFVKIVTPILGDGLGWQALGIFEIALGTGLIFKFAPKILVSVLIFHMIGTFTTFFTAPEIMFKTWPWLLTFEGEFVIKNLALAMGGLILLWSRPSQE